jgi:hypothetical protein
MTPRIRTAGLAVAAVAVLTGLGACTSGSDSSGSAGGGAAVGAVGAPAERGQPSVGGGAGTGSRSGSGSDLGTVTVGEAKIRTVDMTVTIAHRDSVTAKANAAETIATRVGGEVDADERTSGPHASATLVLRIPPDQLIATLNDLSKLGTEKSRHLTSRDVTAQVADVSSRVASAREAIARLRELYRSATRISDVIQIESELSSRESDLESLEAQQRALTAQTATASVTLTLLSRAAPVKHPAVTHDHKQGGFVGGLRNGWDAFVRGAAVLATVLGAILPFAVLLAALALLGKVLRPRLRLARRTPPAPAPPQ